MVFKNLCLLLISSDKERNSFIGKRVHKKGIFIFIFILLENR